jgi:hypothetical protein
LQALRNLTAPREVGRKLRVRFLLTGTLSRTAGDERLDVEVIEIGPPESTETEPVARASAQRPVGQVDELVDAVLIPVLGQLKATPGSDRLAEITRVPTASDSARILCDDGSALMDRCRGLRPGDDQVLSLRALNDSEAALKADPRYLRAALLQASCLLRLGEAERLENCLNAAFSVREPPDRIDALTRLEVDADHAALVKHDLAAATALYQKMLEIDPGHLRALWMLTALHAGEYPPARWPGFSLEKAGDYAARLIVAHPDSAAARLLGELDP